MGMLQETAGWGQASVAAADSSTEPAWGQGAGSGGRGWGLRAGGPAGTSSRQLPQEGKKVLWVEGGKADPSPLGAQDPPRWGRHVWGRHLLQDALLLGVPAWRNELEGSL